jgi:hypothetical protein
MLHLFFIFKIGLIVSTQLYWIMFKLFWGLLLFSLQSIIGFILPLWLIGIIKLVWLVLKSIE